MNFLKEFNLLVRPCSSDLQRILLLNRLVYKAGSDQLYVSKLGARWKANLVSVNSYVGRERGSAGINRVNSE